jgi:hypothetical protein
LHLHQCPCNPICIFPHDQGKGHLTNNPVYALRQQGRDAVMDTTMWAPQQGIKLPTLQH